MMQKSGTFTTIFHVKKCYFHYDFACKKSATLRYAKKYFFQAKFTRKLPRTQRIRVEIADRLRSQRTSDATGREKRKKTRGQSNITLLFGHIMTSNFS
jgi:hypothetical protein